MYSNCDLLVRLDKSAQFLDKLGFGVREKSIGERFLGDPLDVSTVVSDSALEQV